MSRFDAMFDRLSATREGALGAFLMLGDPDLETSARTLDALVTGGADFVEVGIPYSDPLADGPVIQAAAQRALRAGVRTSDCFTLIAGFRDRHPAVPLGILTYANLVLARGRESFFAAATASSADSLLVADLPALEAEAWIGDMRSAGIAPVLIAAGNTPDATLLRIARMSEAFTYCVSRAGITGTHADGEFDRRLIARLGSVAAPPPVFGFGIAHPRHVLAGLEAGARGVICGSAIVECARRGDDVAAFVASLKQATRNDSAA